MGQPVPTDFNDQTTASVIRTLFGTNGGERAPLRFTDLVCVVDSGSSRGLGWVCRQATVRWDGTTVEADALKAALHALLSNGGR